MDWGKKDLDGEGKTFEKLMQGNVHQKAPERRQWQMTVALSMIWVLFEGSKEYFSAIIAGC